MTTNPYGRYVDGKDPLVCLRDTPSRIAQITSGWSNETWAHSYAPGKWSGSELMLHLAQIELVFAARLRFTLGADAYTVQTFEQDDWMAAENEGGDAAAGKAALDAYLALRRLSERLCRRLSATQRAKTATHPEYGAISPDWLMAWITGHELHHLPQLESIR